MLKRTMIVGLSVLLMTALIGSVSGAVLWEDDSEPRPRAGIPVCPDHLTDSTSVRVCNTTRSDLTVHWAIDRPHRRRSSLLRRAPLRYARLSNPMSTCLD